MFALKRLFSMAGAVLLPKSCLVCGRPNPPAELCLQCRPPPPENLAILTPRDAVAFQSLFSLWHYHAHVRQIITAMKYRPSQKLACYFGRALGTALLSLPRDWDLIVPIPSSRSSFRSRLFNPAAVIATEAAKILEINLSCVALKHCGCRAPQASLRPEERAQNVKKAFAAVPELANGKKILLIDDVVTTGSTIMSASLRLRMAGAVAIDVASIARGESLNLI